MKKRHKLYGFLLMALSGGLLLAHTPPTLQAAEQSGCVSCHTDEGKLIANVTKVEAKKSAMQAGTG